MVSDSKFEQNRALKLNSIGQLSQISTTSSFNIVTFSQNMAISGDFNETGAQGIEIISSSGQINFSWCTFKDNWASRTTANIYINRAENVFITRGIFSFTQSLPSRQYIKGSFIHMIAQSKVTIQDSTFQDGTALYGGALYMIGDTSAVIEGSTFTRN